ncbi:hypothetical protein [Imbroritus primus]|uniref:hypothetical protein n=1 Tax=Imbroritus primus TaxID=3058603 RepID=UPI003D161CCB
MSKPIIPPCTLGPKHKWEFVRNIRTGSVTIGPNGSSAKLSVKGRYRCACGLRKLGPMRHEEAAPGAQEDQ